MASQVSLIQMPDVAMKDILENLDLQSMLILRKVCRVFRNFIDDIKPDSSITKISIRVKRKTIIMKITDSKFNDNGYNIEVKYRKHKKGCGVVWHKEKEDKRKLLENQDFVTIFRKDFEILMRHQKSILEEFSLVFENYKSQSSIDENDSVSAKLLNNLNENLKSRLRPLQVRNIDFQISEQEDVMSLLPFIDSESLERIVIANVKEKQEEPLKTDKIVKLDQWITAKESGIFNFVEEAPIQDFYHFSFGVARFHMISMELVLSLKDEFLKYSFFKAFNLQYEENDGDGSLHEQLTKEIGPPYNDYDLISEQTRFRWFFRFNDTDDVLSLQDDSHFSRSIEFKRLKISDAPQNVMII